MGTEWVVEISVEAGVDVWAGGEGQFEGTAHLLVLERVDRRSTVGGV